MLATKQGVKQVVFMVFCTSQCFDIICEHSSKGGSRFRIDAFTIFAVPAQGPHGFHAIGRCDFFFTELTMISLNYLSDYNRTDLLSHYFAR